VTSTFRSPTGIAYDRAGPHADLPVVLLHAGIAGRRMWDPQWPALTAERDAVRLDLRGFGESTARPRGPFSPADDVIDTLATLGIERCHVVGASLGAGVAVEVALTRPERVGSLLLSAPGGSLIAEATPDLREFVDAERSALARGDLDGAVDANLSSRTGARRRSAAGSRSASGKPKPPRIPVAHIERSRGREVERSRDISSQGRGCSGAAIAPEGRGRCHAAAARSCPVWSRRRTRRGSWR